MSEPILPPVPSDLYPYLTEIAERLFSGHAAVMIGSGFSRNAQPQGGSSPQFPDWSELGDLFYEKLHHKRPDAEAKYLSVPTLANEVEAVLGRPALDRIVSSAIPDQDHEPAALHIALLNLPWSDVFTTNYDTLLEKACRSVASQKYGVVVNQHDLVNSKRPRIVKLHGSLSPASRLIVTDEDYRRYPEDHAPFVNTVRQALLENTLCLIGFSGHDPNFLQWIGWIGDNLGRQDAPKMYLVDVRRPSDSQKELLDKRNIVSVDLSQYPDIDLDDHNKALQRFFDYLNSRRGDYNRRLSDHLDSTRSDYNPLRWPHQDQDHTKERDEAIAAQLSTLVPTWRDQRRSYPGWIIVPDDRRLTLWRSTRDWLREMPASDSLPDSLYLEFAFELIWRMEKCLCPIFDNQIRFLELTLNRHLPLVSADAPIDPSSGPVDTSGRSPWGEFEAFKLTLDRPPDHKQNATRKPTFDIGRVTESRSFGYDDTETLTAYRFLRFYEDAGVPFQMPRCTIATKTAAGALSRIAPSLSVLGDGNVNSPLRCEIGRTSL